MSNDSASDTLLFFNYCPRQHLIATISLFKIIGKSRKLHISFTKSKYKIIYLASLSCIYFSISASKDDFKIAGEKTTFPIYSSFSNNVFRQLSFAPVRVVAILSDRGYPAEIYCSS